MKEIHSVCEPVELSCWSFGSFSLLVVVAEEPPKFEDVRDVSLCLYVLTSDSKCAIKYWPIHQK